MSFRIQRGFGLLLGASIIIGSYFKSVELSTTMLGAFMVFWGLDGLMGD